jgi:small subunit ribosomal protein S2
MARVSMKALLETGVHFGHRTRKWNPKMAPYIFTERNNIHILDLHQTLKALEETYQLVTEVTTNGGVVLFVGTKRQAQETIAREAARCGMPYVNERWLGGTLTNWRTIRQRIDYLKDLEARRDRGEFELLPKKEALMLTRKIEKLNMRLGGIREMRGLPDLLFVVDVRREYTAVREADILGIPTIAMVDTNCDPDLIDHIIPANDDAIRAIKLITGVMADAVMDGIAMRKAEEAEPEEAYEYDYEAIADEAAGDEEFLGEATLAKLKSGALSFEGEERAAEAEDEEEVPEAEAEEVADEEAAVEAEEESGEAPDEEEAEADEGDEDEDDEDEADEDEADEDDEDESEEA